MSDLPVAERWFRSQSVADGIALLVEDHLDPFSESNAWHVRGRDRDLVVDTGNGIRDPDGLALLRRDFRPGLEDEIRWYGYEPPEIVITALPAEGFDVGRWRTPASEPTRLLADGDVVDLGDRAFEVLHLPGHTAGSIALWDAAGRLLFSGDTAALDDPLHAEDEDAFVASLSRLRELPVELVCGGHSRPFDRT